MAEFNYTATDADGVIKSKTIIADSEEEVLHLLKSERLTPINVRLVPEAKETFLDNIFNRVNDDDKEQFLDYFASMVEAGLGMSDILQAFYEDLDKPRLRKFVKDTQYKVRNGKKLSECFADYSDLFPPLYVGMIEVGEASGTLAESLRQLATQLKKSNELRGKVNAAMVYPKILIGAVLVIVTILVLFVFPEVATFFEDAELELPGLTVAMIGLSDFVRGNLLLVIGGLVGIRYLIKNIMKQESAKKFYGKAILRMPIFGKLTKTVNVARFTRTFGSLLSSGVNILESADVVKNTMENYVYKSIIDTLKSDLEKGNSLADSLKKFPQYFQPFELRVLAVSERTGEVAEGLTQVAEFYEKKVENLLEGLSAAIQPFLLLIMGGIVVTIALSVLTPIFQLFSDFG